MRYTGKLLRLRPGHVVGWLEMLLEAEGYGLMLFLVRPGTDLAALVGQRITVGHDLLGAVTEVTHGAGHIVVDPERTTHQVVGGTTAVAGPDAAGRTADTGAGKRSGGAAGKPVVDPNQGKLF